MGQKNDQPKQNQITRPQKYFLFYQCCFWAYQIIAIALGSAILARIITAYEGTNNVLSSDQYRHSKETISLWQQGYIIDIRAQNTNNCPEGYNPLINYDWPGSMLGCYCSSVSNGYNFDFVLKGKCSTSLITLGCQVVDEMSAQTLTMWKGSTLLCYKRANSMNFYNSIIQTAPLGGSSPSMSPCSSSQEYKVYTLPGVDCPISAASNQSLGSSQTKLPLDDLNGYFLNFVRETGYPIANIKLTEYQFCEFYDQINISPNKLGSYILEKGSISSSCTKFDPRMIAIDQLDEESFYTNNTRVYDLIQSLPAYPLPSVDYRYILGYIRYPAWTYQCRKADSYNLYRATDHLLFGNASTSLQLTLSVTVPALLVLIVLFRGCFIVRHVVQMKSKKTYNATMLTNDELMEQIPNIDLTKSYKKQFFIFLLEFIILCGSCASIIYSIINCTSDSIWIKQIIKYKCTDSYLENIFMYYEDVLDSTSTILVSATFIWGCLIIFHIVFFVIRNYIGDLYQKKQVIQQQEIPSVENQPLDVLNKEGQLQGIHLQDSSQVILNKQDASEFKIYDADYLMGDGGGETKDNFYNGLDREASLGVVKKKKKKKTITTKKKKNLFKQDQS